MYVDPPILTFEFIRAMWNTPVASEEELAALYPFLFKFHPIEDEL